MKCFYCKADMEKSTTTYVCELKNCIVIIKNVPCMKCTQCGETAFSGDIAKRIDEILDNFQKIMTEVAIVDFSISA